MAVRDLNWEQLPTFVTQLCSTAHCQLLPGSDWANTQREILPGKLKASGQGKGGRQNVTSLPPPPPLSPLQASLEMLSMKLKIGRS